LTLNAFIVHEIVFLGTQTFTSLNNALLMSLKFIMSGIYCMIPVLSRVFLSCFNYAFVFHIAFISETLSNLEINDLECSLLDEQIENLEVFFVESCLGSV